MPVAVFGTVAPVTDISARRSCVTTDPCGAHHARHESSRFRRCISLAASAPRRAPCPPVRAPNRSRPRRSASTRRCGGLVPPPAPLSVGRMTPRGLILPSLAPPRPKPTKKDCRRSCSPSPTACLSSAGSTRTQDHDKQDSGGMIGRPEYTLSLPPPCPTNRDHLTPTPARRK